MAGGEELRAGRLELGQEKAETGSEDGIGDAFQDAVDLCRASAAGDSRLRGGRVGEDLDERAVGLARLVADCTGCGAAALSRQSADGGDGVVLAASVALLHADGMDEA